MPTPPYTPISNWLLLDEALMRLDSLAAPMKQELIEALVLTIVYDRHVVPTEAELLRVICASLHCPLPPLVANLASDVAQNNEAGENVTGLAP